MAPLNPNNTARFRFHYVTVGRNHTVQFRSAASPAVMGILVGNLFAAMGSTLLLGTILTADWAPAGSDIFNPVVTGVEGQALGLEPGLTSRSRGGSHSWAAPLAAVV